MCNKKIQERKDYTWNVQRNSMCNCSSDAEQHFSRPEKQWISVPECLEDASRYTNCFRQTPGMPSWERQWRAKFTHCLTLMFFLCTVCSWVRRNIKGKQVEIQPECPFSSLFKAEPVLDLWSCSPLYREEDTNALRVPKSASGCRAS